MISIGDAILKITGDPSGLNQAMNAANQQVTTMAQKMQKALLPLGAAFTALGAAGLKFADSAREMNAQLGMVGLTIGASTKEMQDLALATTDVTFSLSSVTNTFDLLARAGIRSKDEMQAAAKSFDSLADATGSSAEVVADQLIPAFKMFGISVADAGDEVDKFTWLNKNTTVSLEEFSSAMQYVAAYGRELNLSLEDMVAIMAALETKGITGSATTRVFRTAISQAASGVVSLNEALGLSQTEIDAYKTQLEGATGITQEYADIANSQYGIMDKLKQKWQELTLRIGSFLEPLEPILAAMTALGPAMIVMSTSAGIATVKLIAHKVALIATTIATKAATAAQWLFNAAISANPLGLLVLAIGAAVTGLAIFKMKTQEVKSAAETNFQATYDKTKTTFEEMKVIAQNASEDMKNKVVENWDTMFDEIVRVIEEKKNIVMGAFVEVLTKLPEIDEAERAELLRMTGLYYDDKLAEAKDYDTQAQEIFKGIREGEIANTTETYTELLRLAEGAKGLALETLQDWKAKELTIFRKTAEEVGVVDIGMIRDIQDRSAALTKEEKAKWATYCNDVIAAMSKLKEEGYITEEKADYWIGIFTNLRESTVQEMERTHRETVGEAWGMAYELAKVVDFIFKLGEKLKWPGFLFSPIRFEAPPTTGLQVGGIITKPTLALLGEAGPEAVIPLGKPSPVSGNPIHIHIGNFLGDQSSLRQFTRQLQQIMREEERRTSFSGINRGYWYGGSHV